MSTRTESFPLRVTAQPAQKIGKAELTRVEILNAGLDFVWSRRFSEMTVSSLMSATGVSRSAFYRYFSDLPDLMTALLDTLQVEIVAAVEPWLTGVGDPVALIREALDGLVRVCYERGPFMRAISDAAATDERCDEAWRQFLGQFDQVACGRIKADQEQGLIPDFDVQPVATALNRLDAFTLITAFGQHPRMDPEPVREALARIWISTLYGRQWIESGSSNLNRTR